MNRQSLQVGAALPEMRLRIDDGIIQSFAAIADDHSRMHFDDAFARERGFPAAIAHGAIAASTFCALLERTFEGWPAAGEDIRITFIGPAFRGDEAVTTGRVSGAEAGMATIELWCAAGDRKLAVAQATVSLARAAPDGQG